MANSGWTADPDEIIVPPDATDNEPRVYIGPNDPNALAFSQLASIMFYWANNRAFMFSIEANPGGNSAEFHIWSFDDDEIKQIIDIVHDDDLTFGEDHSSLQVGQDESLYEVSIRARQQIFIQADGEPNPDSAPTVYLGSPFEPLAAGLGMEADIRIYGGKSVHRGIRARVTSDVNSAAIGAAETVIMTLPSFTYRNGRVYEVKITGAQNISVATVLSTWKVRKTNAAGQVVADYQRTEGNGTNLNVHGINLSNRMFWVDRGADVTATLVLTLVAAGGTSIMSATAQSIRKVEIFDVGHIFDYDDIELEPQLV